MSLTQEKFPRSGPDNLTLIQVSGICHGPVEFARSIIHDRVAEYLQSANPAIDTVFVPSTDIHKNPLTGKIYGIQGTPTTQLDRLRSTVESVLAKSRIPVALAHSSGSIATIAALLEGSLPLAVLISPTIIDPRDEFLGSKTPRQRLNIISSPKGDSVIMLWPDNMDYPTYYPRDYFDDPLLLDPIITQPEGFETINRLTIARARIFLGQYDWNSYKDRYSEFIKVEVVEGEKHSFELLGQESARKVAEAVVDLAENFANIGETHYSN